MKRQVSRRAVLRWSVGAGLAAVSCGAGYTWFLEPDWLAVERVRVVVPYDLLPSELDGTTIAHLSDLHWGPYTGMREIRAAVETANSLEPDLVVVTGDFVHRSAGYAEPCARELAKLRAPLGVFSVPGNHDYWTDIVTVVESLQAVGLTVLRNSALRMEGTAAPLWVAGIDDVCEQHHDLDAALALVPLEEPVLLLVHEPDFADQAARSRHRILLQLSGHSHGGQVNLPGLGRPLLPWLGLKYPAGLSQVRDTPMQVYTNRGIGVISPPVRFNCRPEVTLLTLARGG